MQNDYVAPIDHTTGSAAASTLGGAAGGSVAPAVKGGAVGFTLPIVLGAALFAIPAFMISGGVALGAVAAWTLGAGAVGAILGGVFGSIPGMQLGGLIGGITGAVKGGREASQQVNLERGQAALLQAQIDVARSQAMAQAMSQQAQAPVTNIYAPSAANDNRYAGVPIPGSPMNQAASTLEGGQGMQYQGTVASRSLEPVVG